MEKDLYRRPSADAHPANLSPEYKSTSGRAPRQPAIVLPQTLSEITGPLLANERLDASENDLAHWPFCITQQSNALLLVLLNRMSLVPS